MSLDDNIIEWNVRFPLDRWWRNKHGIAYNSPAHRESNFLDQLFEFKEERLMREVESRKAYDPFAINMMKQRTDFESKEDQMRHEADLAREAMKSAPDEIEE